MITKIRNIALLVVLMALVVAPAIPAMATVSGGSMQDVAVYRNLSAAGDMAVIGYYNSTANITTPASLTTIIRYVSANGTLLATTNPYVFSPFDNDGYGTAAFGLYLSSNTSWGEASYIEVVGLPAYYADPPLITYTLTAGDYTTETTTDENRADLTAYILSLCDIFLTVYPDVELKSITGDGTTLSSYGEAYFGSVIDGLQFLVPDLYLIQTSVPEVIETQVYTMATGEGYTPRMVDTDLFLGLTRLGALFSVSAYVIIGTLNFALCMIFIIYSMRAWHWEMQAGLGMTALEHIGVSIIFGDLIFTMVMIISLIAVIGLAFAVLGKRA